MMKRRMLVLFAALLCSCDPAPDYVEISPAGEQPLERLFLASLFGEGGELWSQGFRALPEGQITGQARPALFIDILSSWEQEGAFGDIPLSKVFLVPRDDVLAGRTSASLADCLEDRETLVPPEEIRPPFVALRVDGLALGDAAYPLIRATGLRVRGAEGADDPRLRERLRRLAETLRAASEPRIPPAPKPVWLAAGGDLMLGRGAETVLLREGPAGIFGGTAEMLRDADIALVNLEGVISSRGTAVPKSYNFRFAPDAARALRQAGIGAVLHANNHTYDYGAEAFLDSLSWLEKAGIGVVGAGIDDENAAAPFVFRRGEEVFRIFGLASFPRERSGWDGVSAAAGPGQPGMLHAGRGGGEKLMSRFSPGEGSPVEVVLFHGGTEWSSRPDGDTRELYTELIRAGADLLIGSHPHVVHGFEWVLGKPVFWSLGNYVFGGMEGTPGGEEGLFIRLGFVRSRLVYLEPFALRLSHIRTDIAPEEKLAVFYARSRELREERPLP